MDCYSKAFAIPILTAISLLFAVVLEPLMLELYCVQCYLYHVI